MTLLDWNDQYCQNDYINQNNYTNQSNLQIHFFVYQITSGILHRTQTKVFTICTETQ